MIILVFSISNFPFFPFIVGFTHRKTRCKQQALKEQTALMQETLTQLNDQLKEWNTSNSQKIVH